MKTIRLVGIIIIFLGFGLKLADFPGYTLAFVIGAVLIVSARLYQWYMNSRRTS